MVLIMVMILALPWAHAFVQIPRKPFVNASLLGGILGAGGMAIATGLTIAPNPQWGALRALAAAFAMGGPLGTLLGQAIVAMFVPPRERRVGALVGFLVGPLLGWPPLYLFPTMEHHLWQGAYWVIFWLGSWAGWCALGGAALGVHTLSWEPVWRRSLQFLSFLLFAPAVVVGARYFDQIRLHVTPLDTLRARHDVVGILWKLDHKEEIPEAAGALGPLCQGADPRIVSRLSAILDGTFPGLLGQDRSDPDYRLARCQAAQSLGQAGGRPALDALLKYASEPDPEVRGAVLDALATLADPQARQALQKAARDDPDLDIRSRARSAVRPPQTHKPIPTVAPGDHPQPAPSPG